MGLMDMVRQDIIQITSNLDGFAVPATFLAPSGESILVNVIFSKHHTAIDTDGNRVNSKNAHLSFAESLMVNYPIRNEKGEVYMKDHKVRLKDSTGLESIYIIREWYPDETVGLIGCVLGKFHGGWTADSTWFTVDSTRTTIDSL